MSGPCKYYRAELFEWTFQGQLHYRPTPPTGALSVSTGTRIGLGLCEATFVALQVAIVSGAIGSGCMYGSESHGASFVVYHARATLRPPKGAHINLPAGRAQGRALALSGSGAAPLPPHASWHCQWQRPRPRVGPPRWRAFAEARRPAACLRSRAARASARAARTVALHQKLGSTGLRENSV